MKILFDNIIFSLQKSGGGSVYWYEIVSRFIRSNHHVDCVDFKSDNLFHKKISVSHGKTPKTLFLMTRFLPIINKLKSKTIVHSSYYRISLSRKAINVVTIHDFTPELFFKGISRFINYWQKKIAIMNADGIICVSENTKKDLLHFHPQASKKNIKVIYNGIGKVFYKIDTISEDNIADDEVRNVLREQYVLYVGHRTSYKNFLVAVKSIQVLSGRLKLVIVGEPLTNQEKNEINAYLSTDSYVVLSGKSSELLNLLYNRAFCLIYPSSYEGFGIPVAEAMRAGCPVVCTNKSSLPEVAGDAAIFIDEINEINFSEAIESLYNLTYRNELIERGFIQSEKFSWDCTYENVQCFYESLYNANTGI